MEINHVIFNTELADILGELRKQLTLNNIPLLQKEPKKSAESLQVQCPYHGEGQERRPSAGIRMSDGMFHCFTCGEIHTLPEVISHCFGHEDLGIFGWSWLLKNFLTIQVEERKDVELDFDRGHHSNSNASSSFISEEELDSYRYYHPYWAKRKIVDDWLLELFDLGYDRKTRCITFPVRDINGNCLFVARRSVSTKFFNYPKGVEKPLYGLYELYRIIGQKRGSAKTNIIPALMIFGGEIIVCESMIDALTCWQYGRVAVALNGLGNDLQFKQLRDLPCRKLILATDNDEAGLRARERIRRNVSNKIITEYEFPEGRKDINELSEQEFKNLIEIF